MEYFDTFDENGVFISSEDETDIHYKGLWHKIVRIWIYDKDGNIWLKKDKKSGKLDTINEVHIKSSESIISCFDRAMFESLGIHLPANSSITLVGMKPMSIKKTFSDNSEFIENYFLCDYIADFNDDVRFFIFNEKIQSLVKCNAQGIISLLSSKANEIVAYEYFADAMNSESKVVLSYNDIEKNIAEDTFLKYSTVINLINLNAKKLAKQKKEEEKLRKYAEKNNEESHADENEGTEVY